MRSQIQITEERRGLRWWLRRITLAIIVLVLLIGAVTWLAGQSARAELVRQYPSPGQLVDVGGYRLHLNCTGQGAPIVVLDAGMGGFSVHWAQVQSQVARFTRVCTYDRAGLGWSESSPHPRTSQVMVDELHRLLAAAEVEKPYLLVGHSFGGMNTRLYAHQYPDEVLGLVQVDAVHEEQTNRLPVLRTMTGQIVGQFRWLSLLSSLGIVALLSEQIPNQGLSTETFAQYGAVLATTRYFETASKEMKLFESSLAEYRSANIRSLGKMPLVIISRGLSEAIPGLSEAETQQNEAVWAKMQAELATLSSNSQRLTAQRSGHEIPTQQPEVIVEAIERMVQTTPVTWSESAQPARELTQVAARRREASSVEFQLLAGFVNGKVSYIGVGGNIDGAVNPDLVVPAGAPFQITLTNGDGMSHDLFIPELGIKSATVSRKDQVTTLTVPVAQDQVGVYVYYCTQPGHRQAGQEGRLIVRAAD